MKELLINYNIPNYSPLDWFINLGFIPAERAKRWSKLSGGLPKINRREYFENESIFTSSSQGSKSAKKPGLTVIQQPRPEL